MRDDLMLDPVMVMSVPVELRIALSLEDMILIQKKERPGTRARETTAVRTEVQQA